MLSIVRKTFFQILIIVLTMILYNTGDALGQQRNTPDQQQISKIESDWNQALQQHNLDFFSRILTSDFLYININGIAETSLEFTAQMSISEFKKAVTTQPVVRVYGGSVAVFSGLREDSVRQNLDPEKPAQFTDRRIRFTKIFIKVGTDWKLALYQETILTPLSRKGGQ